MAQSNEIDHWLFDENIFDVSDKDDNIDYAQLPVIGLDHDESESDDEFPLLIPRDNLYQDNDEPRLITPMATHIMPPVEMHMPPPNYVDITIDDVAAGMVAINYPLRNERRHQTDEPSMIWDTVEVYVPHRKNVIGLGLKILQKIFV